MRVLERYATDRTKEAAPATVQYELSVLRRAMNLAVKQGRLASRPTFPEIQVRNARTGFFEQAEFEAVVNELPDPLKYLALVGYYTGARPPATRSGPGYLNTGRCSSAGTGAPKSSSATPSPVRPTSGRRWLVSMTCRAGREAP